MPRPPTVDIDEFTLVLSLIDKDIGADWIIKCDEMLEEFLKLSRLETMFGRLAYTQSNLPNGYTSGITVDTHPWYLKIAWHEDFPRMGICVRLSAQAWSAYQYRFDELYQSSINLASFVAMVQSPLYSVHLSRVDLVADYFDFEDPVIPDKYLSPDDIYKSLLNNKYLVQSRVEKNGKINWITTNRKMSAYDKCGTYYTFYLGSKASSYFLRCYDKKAEQIETKGVRYEEALGYHSWVRFEMVVRYDYAKQITTQLLGIQSLAELQAMIARHISDKYRFYDTVDDEETHFTKVLQDIAAGIQISSLKSSNTRNTELARSIDYIKHSSGLYNLLYKVQVIWKVEGVQKLLTHFHDDFYQRFRSKEVGTWDADNWLKQHSMEYKDTNIEKVFGLDKVIEKIIIPAVLTESLTGDIEVSSAEDITEEIQTTEDKEKNSLITTK